MNVGSKGVILKVVGSVSTVAQWMPTATVGQAGIQRMYRLFAHNGDNLDQLLIELTIHSIPTIMSKYSHLYYSIQSVYRLPLEPMSHHHGRLRCISAYYLGHDNVVYKLWQ